MRETFQNDSKGPAVRNFERLISEALDSLQGKRDQICNTICNM